MGANAASFAAGPLPTPQARGTNPELAQKMGMSLPRLPILLTQSVVNGPKFVTKCQLIPAPRNLAQLLQRSIRQ